MTRDNIMIVQFNSISKGMFLIQEHIDYVDHISLNPKVAKNKQLLCRGIWSIIVMVQVNSINKWMFLIQWHIDNSITVKQSWCRAQYETICYNIDHIDHTSVNSNVVKLLQRR